MKKSPRDYSAAFGAISKGTRFIYIHAYQSFVWNKAVSERLRNFGLEVLIGDLVIDKNQEDLLEIASEHLSNLENDQQDPVSFF